MNDNDRFARDGELLSALMDGEASEHEVRQALRAVETDAALAARWQRFHVAQAALRGDAGGFAHVDLRGRIAASVDSGAPSSAASPRAIGGSRRLPAWLKPLASVAVAASVAVVTVFAWQAAGPGAGPAPAQVAAIAPAAGAQTVALGPMVLVRADGEELVLPEEPAGSPTAAQDRLNAYMARHAQASTFGSTHGLAPYARVVSLEGEQAP